MKNLGIILSVVVLLFSSVACMKQDKDVFASADAKARTSNKGNIIAKGLLTSGMTTHGGPVGAGSASCPTPIGLVVSTDGNLNIVFSWMVNNSSNVPSSYIVTLSGYNNNAPYTIQTLSTTTNSVTFNSSLFSPQDEYTIEVISDCINTQNSGMPYSVTFTANNVGGGSGGTAMVVVDDLDSGLYDNPNGTINWASGGTGGYQYDAALNAMPSIPMIAEDLYDVSTNAPYPSISFNADFVSNPGSVNNCNCKNMYRFTVPNIENNIRNTNCVEEELEASSTPDYLLKIAIDYPIIVGTRIGYQEESSASTIHEWKIIKVEGTTGILSTSTSSNPFSTLISLPGLKRGHTYRIKFFSKYENDPQAIRLNHNPEGCFEGYEIPING